MIVNNFQPIRETKAPVTKGPSNPSPGGDRFEPGPVLDPNLPDVSGMARFKNQFLAVTDAKSNTPNPRLGTIDPKTGAFSALASDWGGERPARDLEGITPLKGQEGKYLAVEGSAFKDWKNRLFQLQVDENGSKVEKAYDLPKFSQEIEGVVEMPMKDGRRLVVLGGRGGEEGQKGRLFWGVLDQEKGSLNFPPQGMEGVEVNAPKLQAKQQRDISELQLKPDGSLWASATADLGNAGPFESAVYQLGTLKADPNQPFTPAQAQDAARVKGTKIEGFAEIKPGRWLTGADNESLGGQIGYLF